ncbi:MAG: pyridoxal phosphate-dependent aminotransferase, partial [Methanobacteriota archaeon]
VPLGYPSLRFDPDELRRAFTPRTKAIIVNSPNNPTGRVFDRSELELIASLCREHDVIAVTDEIYEHIRYPGGDPSAAGAGALPPGRSEVEHIPLATLDGMADRTITISGASKTFSVTGWRVGWIVAPPGLTAGIRKVHDFLTVGAPAPLQEAVAEGLGLGRPYFDTLSGAYRARRDLLFAALETAGFRPRLPQGAYYILCDISGFGFDDDSAFARWLITAVGVAGVPGSSFFSRPELGRDLIRFTFCKTDDVLREAGDRLRGALGQAGARPA